MALEELESDGHVQKFYHENTNVVICFSATWCGPCRASKPALEEMATKYQQDVTKDVKFGIVYEHNLGESIHHYNVRAFPTYVLMVNQTEVERVEGVNLDGIRAMIDRAGCQADLTGGQSLGGGDVAAALSPEEARAQRLAKLGGATAQKDDPMQVVAAEPDNKDKTEENVEMKDAPQEEPSVVDPVANLDQEVLKTLTESMGFSMLRAQKGLLNGGNMEGAVEWLMQHQDDVDIDDPIPADSAATPGGAVAQSYKCNDCGKILSNMANLELHANKTGHSDFEESTDAVKPLTAEEKAAKIAEIKDLLKAKRSQREEAEKEDEKEREKQRRFMGKEMAKTREELEREQLKRAAILRRKEKEAAKRERERIRAELEKDKAERRANQGKLQSKLGVDGYTPDAIQYDVQADGSPVSPDAKKQQHKKIKASATKIDEYIKKVSSYRAGGDGGKCLKILLAYVGNVVDKPDEVKFRSIKMENKVFKTKVKPFIGAKSLLLAVGFNPNEAGDHLVLKEDADTNLLRDTKAKLEKAYAAY